MADTTRPITRLTIKDTETGTETETDVKTCARGVECDEGKTVQDHISDFVAHKKDVNRHVLVQVSGDEPETGPALWFDSENLLNYKDKNGNKSVLYPATKPDNVEGLSALLTAAKQEAQTNLNSHTSDKSNPHGVTAEQVGADPSGSAAAVQTNLDSHTSNTSNPHNVTYDQVGAAAASHTHSGSDLTSAVPISKGGTGATTAADAIKGLDILQPATATKIGLPPSATPDDMFAALGDTGELHVWRKTVTNQQAGYTLGSVETRYLGSASNNNQYDQLGFTTSNTINVSDSGAVTQNSPTANSNLTYLASNAATIQAQIRGKFITTTYWHTYQNTGTELTGLWFVPSDATVTYITNGVSLGYPYNYCFIIDKIQSVTGHGAGTTTTYPVSTNPNAWQEASDAKAAGYVLEAAKQMVAFKTTNSSYKYYAYNYAESISVSDDGTVSLVGELKASGRPFQADSFNAAKGKFCQFIIEDWFDGYVSSEITGIVFIPSDAVFSVTTLQATCSKVQPVTGYAAIPAGTTIEYLGKLGDKARVQVLSYIGTGTYGADNPCSLTFDFTPKIIFWVGVTASGFRTYAFPAKLSTNYSQTDAIGYAPNGYKYTKVSDDRKTIMWYQTTNSDYQLNYSGSLYATIAIG